MSKLLATFTSEKPHSSITDWIEILSSERYTDNDLDGIPELVDSINLQGEGPTEAARAIRKKLKYGNVHRQLRALTILKALVENCGPKFQSSFANDALITRIKTMASDPLTDESVKKKLMMVLGSWHRQFKDDPKMSTVANLYAACGGGVKTQRKAPAAPVRNPEYEEEIRRREEQAQKLAEQKERERLAREDEKRKAKEEKERRKKAASAPAKPKPKPFDFEKEKPAIINSIANASQAAIQLTNALKLVNREKESISENATVQEFLEQAKASRKVVVRYIQRVENEELIGTLLDVNERIIQSLQLYDQMLKPPEHDSDEDDTTAKMQSLTIQTTGSEISKLQGKQRAAIARANSRSSLNVISGGVSRPPPSKTVHPDLKDLNWGSSLDDGDRALQPPLQPRAAESTEDVYRQGSLSDYSDYTSEDDERQSRPSTSTAATSAAGPSYRSRGYDNLLGNEDELLDAREARAGLLTTQEDDPFADPFADSRSDFGTPTVEKQRL